MPRAGPGAMTTTIRWLLLLEGGVFVAAALINSGYLMPGSRCHRAGTAGGMTALPLVERCCGSWNRAM
jgi:hypothetical protein